jgi:hypothetical protein
LGRFEDLLVRKTQDIVAEHVEIGVPVIVMGLLMSGFVNAAIQLHDEFQRVAIEIGHIGSDRNLAAELETEELTISQPLP